MFKRFLSFLKESPFIEGMGRILDFMRVIESGIRPIMRDAESLNEYREKDMGDFKHFIILVEKKGNDAERITQQQSISA
jgi:hypothetical protein